MNAALASIPPDDFKRAMRGFGGAVCVITTGEGARRTGATVNTLVPFSAEPPIVLVSLRRDGSAAREVAASGRLTANFLHAGQQDVAERFTGFRGDKGEARFAAATWSVLRAGGAPALDDAIFNFDCVADETIERHSHMLILSRIVAVRHGPPGAVPLCYIQGGYRAIG